LAILLWPGIWAMLFGGGLRETFGGATPMMDNRMRATTMTYTAVYD